MRSEQYRRRAQELRTIAQDWMDHQKQQALLWLARDYERMAEEEERNAVPFAWMDVVTPDCP